MISLVETDVGKTNGTALYISCYCGSLAGLGYYQLQAYLLNPSDFHEVSISILMQFSQDARLLKGMRTKY
jgi:hypothetical protein